MPLNPRDGVVTEKPEKGIKDTDPLILNWRMPSSLLYLHSERSLEGFARRSVHFLSWYQDWQL